MTKSPEEGSDAPKTAIVGNFTDDKKMKNEVKSVSPLTSIGEIESENGNHEIVKNKKRRRSSFKKKGALTKKMLSSSWTLRAFGVHVRLPRVRPLRRRRDRPALLRRSGHGGHEHHSYPGPCVFPGEMILNCLIRDDTQLETVMNLSPPSRFC